LRSRLETSLADKRKRSRPSLKKKESEKKALRASATVATWSVHNAGGKEGRWLTQVVQWKGDPNRIEKKKVRSLRYKANGSVLPKAGVGKQSTSLAVVCEVDKGRRKRERERKPHQGRCLGGQNADDKKSLTPFSRLNQEGR